MDRSGFYPQLGARHLQSLDANRKFAVFHIEFGVDFQKLQIWTVSSLEKVHRLCFRAFATFTDEKTVEGGTRWTRRTMSALIYQSSLNESLRTQGPPFGFVAVVAFASSGSLHRSVLLLQAIARTAALLRARTHAEGGQDSVTLQAVSEGKLLDLPSMIFKVPQEPLHLELEESVASSLKRSVSC